MTDQEHTPQFMEPVEVTWSGVREPGIFLYRQSSKLLVATRRKLVQVDRVQPSTLAKKLLQQFQVDPDAALQALTAAPEIPGWMVGCFISATLADCGGEMRNMLHTAAAQGREDLVRKVIDLGADPGQLTTLVDQRPQVASDIARAQNHDELATVLDGLHADSLFSRCSPLRPQRLQAAVADQMRRGQPEHLAALMNQRRPWPGGPRHLLHHACERGSAPLVATLLRAKAEVDQFARVILARRGCQELSDLVEKGVHQEKRHASLESCALQISDLLKESNPSWRSLVAEVPEVASALPSERRFPILHNFAWFKMEEEFRFACSLTLDFTTETRDGLTVAQCAMAPGGKQMTDEFGSSEADRIRRRDLGSKIALVSQVMYDRARAQNRHLRCIPNCLEQSPQTHCIKPPHRHLLESLPRHSHAVIVEFQFMCYFDLLEERGKGPSSCVYLLRNKGSGNQRACRVMKDEGFKDIAALEVVDHPHVLKIFNMYHDGPRVVTIMPKAQMGDLREGLKALTEAPSSTSQQKWGNQVVHQLLLALKHCHSQGVAHGNIKPENVLIMNDGPEMWLRRYVVLTDFARVVQPLGPPRILNTPGYAAPEMLAGRAVEHPPADIWALGAVIFYIKTGEHAVFHPNAFAAARPTVPETPGAGAAVQRAGVAAQGAVPNIPPAAPQWAGHAPCPSTAPSEHHRVSAPNSPRLAEEVRADMVLMQEEGPGSRFLDGAPTRPAQWSRLHEAAPLVRGMMMVDPSGRLTAAQCLENSWIPVSEAPSTHADVPHRICPTLRHRVLTVALLIPAATKATPPLYDAFQKANVAGRMALSRRQWVAALESYREIGEKADALFCSLSARTTELPTVELEFSDFVVAFLVAQPRALAKYLQEVDNIQGNQAGDGFLPATWAAESVGCPETCECKATDIVQLLLATADDAASQHGDPEDAEEPPSSRSVSDALASQSEEESLQSSLDIDIDTSDSDGETEPEHVQASTGLPQDRELLIQPSNIADVCAAFERRRPREAAVVRSVQFEISGAAEAVPKCAQLLGKLDNLQHLKLNASGNEITDEGLENLGRGIGGCSRLASLECNVSRNQIVGDRLGHLGENIGRCADLKRIVLNVSRNHATSRRLGLFGQGISRCAQLTSADMNFASNQITDDRLGNFGQGLAGCARLGNLALNFAGNKISHNGLGRLSQGIGKCDRLSTILLDFADNQGGGGSLGRLGEGIGNCSQLSCLDVGLARNDITGESLSKVLEGIGRCALLGSLGLDLEGNQIAKEGCWHLCEGLAYIKELRNIRLSLQGNQIAKEGCWHLCEGLAYIKELRNIRLSLQGNLLAGEGLVQLGERLGNCAKLEALVLDVTGNKITIGKLARFAQELRRCPVLERLDWSLGDNPIADEGLGGFGEQIGRLGKLTSLSLNVDGCPITGERLAQFGEGIGHCSLLKSVDLLFRGTKVRAASARPLLWQLHQFGSVHQRRVDFRVDFSDCCITRSQGRELTRTMHHLSLRF
mmetsp:Transcript_49687/g.112753  ORF Transcript_49687/g.112753 Transcript_49687/m.112753 type:complete len:1500 (-) Transcript_49687:209-4708(-)